MAGFRNWCLPKNQKSNKQHDLIFIRACIGLNPAENGQVNGFYFLIGFRSRKTMIAIAAANNSSDSNVSAIKVAISKNFIDRSDMCECMQTVCMGYAIK